jgi:hypothetical protein
MTERLEQRFCIKFCQKLGDSQVETIRKIHTVFGDDAMGITQIKEWYNRFKDGRTSVESEPRSGRPSTCRNDQVIAKVNAVVMRDRRLTIREIAEEVGLSTFSAHSIVTEDLAMKRVSAKFVPKLLTAERTFLAKNQTPVLQQAPYSPDMAPCDFWLFRKLKRPLKGTRFQTREDIMAATTAELNSIPKEAFSACFQQWRHRWEKCVESQGNYFEGD